MYCSVCSVRSAYQNNDQKLKENLASFFGTSPENIVCEDACQEKLFRSLRPVLLEHVRRKKD